jgi:hypothetical protein
MRMGMQNPRSLFHADPKSYWRQLSREPVRVIGHFPIAAYNHAADSLRIALLRHPVDRLISHYFFWSRHAPTDQENILWQNVREGKLSLEQFSRIPLINGLYRHKYFQGFDMRRFDLLIIQERMASGAAALSQLLGRPICNEVMNSTSHFWPGYGKAKLQIRSSQRVWDDLRRSLREEIDFYETCLNLPNAA